MREAYSLELGENTSQNHSHKRVVIKTKINDMRERIVGLPQRKLPRLEKASLRKG